MQKGTCRFVGGRQERDGILVDAEFLQNRLDEADDGAIAVVGILATLENTSAACLQTE